MLKKLVVVMSFLVTMIGVNIDFVNTQAHSSDQIVVSSCDISLGSTAEARDRIFSDFDRASRRVANRTRDRIVRETERNIQRRIDDHIRDQAELLDPNSRTYQEYKCKNLLNSLPYGVTRVLVQGSIDTVNAPGCVFLERRTIRLLERMISEYSNVVIENDCYKKGRNNRRGEWIGFDILKAVDANEIIVTQ